MVLPLIGEALGVVHQFMQKLPNWEQKKTDEFHKLWKEWDDEVKKPYGLRDDELVLDLGDRMHRHVKDFSEIVRLSSISRVQQN